MPEVRSRWACFMPEWLPLLPVPRCCPDQFELTPRVPPEAAGRVPAIDLRGEDGSKVYDIEGEFSALSPRRCARELFTAPEAVEGWSPESLRSEPAQPEPADPSGTVELPQDEYAALLCEIKLLRHENQDLRQTVAMLQAAPSPELRNIKLLEVAAQEARCSSPQSRSTSGTCTPSALPTPSPRQRRQPGDMEEYVGSALSSVQEPQEEPWVHG